MNENEIAEKAWKQFEQDNDADAFFSNVSSVGYPFGFRLPYYKALVLHRKGRDNEAAGQIALAISHFEGIVNNNRCNKNCNARCGNLLYRFGSIINFNTGNKKQVAIYNTKGAQYDPMPSDYNDTDYVNVFSFRRYNQYSIQDLTNNEITVVCPSEMNDPFDSIYNLYRDIGNLEEICPAKEDIPGFHDIFNYFRVRSFVKGENNRNLRNILMWSHYADGHKGFCIKYHLSKHFINHPTSNGYLWLKNINYSDKPIAVNCAELDDNTAFATKNSRWKYEHEVRLISYDVSTNSPFLAHPLDNDSFIDTIYFGYKCDANTKRTICNIVKRNTPNCSFKEMAIDTKRNIYNLLIHDYKPNNINTIQ